MNFRPIHFARFALLAAIVACTPAERATVVKDANVGISAEQTLCLLAEHYSPTKLEQGEEVACAVTSAAAKAFVLGLELADQHNDGGTPPPGDDQ